MEGQKKNTGLFREKSLEAIESPENLNEYLHVTSPGVWLVLSAAIAVLLGFTLWGIFGRIDTSIDVAVEAKESRTVCYVPFEELKDVTKSGSVLIEGKDYEITPGGNEKTVLVSDEMNPYLRLAGGLNIGDIAVEMEIDAALDEGIYTGTVTTESLRPIMLLFE